MDTPIRDSYWVIEGSFLAGEYPATPHEGSSKIKLQSILDAGVTAFIDLTEEGELKPYTSLLTPVATNHNRSVTHRRMPIKDLGITTTAKMSELLKLLASLIKAGEIVYLHCWGGIGRTGTVAGCYMIQELCMTPEQALRKIEDLRKDTPDGWRRSPETEEQRAMVMKWMA